MCFVIWIYHILYISSPIREHLVDFQTCDFIFSCSFLPQEAWALTYGRGFPVEGHGQSLWGLQNWNSASLLFPWFGLCGPGSWEQGLRPPLTVLGEARLLVEFAAGGGPFGARSWTCVSSQLPVEIRGQAQRRPICSDVRRSSQGALWSA